MVGATTTTIIILDTCINTNTNVMTTLRMVILSKPFFRIRQLFKVVLLTTINTENRVLYIPGM